MDYFNASILLMILVILSCVAIAFASISPYQEQLEEQAKLQEQEATYLPAEAVYQQHKASMAMYKKVVVGNLMTAHANDGLLNFLAELEEKLPKDVHVLAFTSNDIEAVITMRVEDKEMAAGVIKTLREFDSVMTLNVESLREESAPREGEAVLVAPTEYVEFSINLIYYPFDVEEPESVEGSLESAKDTEEEETEEVSDTESTQ